MNAPNSFQAGNRIAVSFRGYNVTNAGKTRELLSHPLLEDRLRDRLAEASRLCHDVLGLQVDLYKDVAEGRPSSLETYSPDLATIVATELAHWDALRDILGKDGCSRIRLLTGYSLGEVTAVIIEAMRC